MLTLEPTPENLRRVRETAGLTQREVAEIMYLQKAGRVSEYETGAKPIEPARWRLLLIAVGRDPIYGPRHPVRAKPLESA